MEMADHSVADLLMEVFQRLGLGVDDSTVGTGQSGAILRNLHQEKDSLRGVLHWNQSESGGRHNYNLSRVGCSRHAPMPGEIRIGELARGAA
jgi:hypothetical protein